MSKWQKAEKRIEEAVHEAGKILDSLNLSENDRQLAFLLGKEMNTFVAALAPMICMGADNPAEVIMAATASLLARQQAAFDAARKAGLKV